MRLPPSGDCRRIRRLHGMLGSSSANEAESARRKIIELLAKHGLTWNDLSAVLWETEEDATGSVPAAPPEQADPAPQVNITPQVNVLDLVLRLIELHVAITPDQRMAAALWMLHSYVFGRFAVTPRLALLSPVRGCGKTTLLILIERLAANADRTDNITAASIYHMLSVAEQTLLVDEGDNLGLLSNNVLRAVFNAGHRRGGAVRRFVSGRPRKFAVYAPLAVAAIGTLSLPLMHRSVVIDMQRRAADAPPLERLDEFDQKLKASQGEIQKWANTCTLNVDPEMPPQLQNRAADNWRILLAIADDLGRGEEARAAALALSAGRLDEDYGVTLLGHIRDVFDGPPSIDRISSAALVEALHAIDGSPWQDWRGPNDDRPGRKLSQTELARLLRPFGIRPRSMWPLGPRRPGTTSSQGYVRSQFAQAWATYCTPASTPAQPRRRIALAGTAAGTAASAPKT